MKATVIITIVISSILLNVVSAELAMWSFNGFDSYTEYLEMRRLHQYHGTDHAINDGDGNCLSISLAFITVAVINNTGSQKIPVLVEAQLFLCILSR